MSSAAMPGLAVQVRELTMHAQRSALGVGGEGGRVDLPVDVYGGGRLGRRCSWACSLPSLSPWGWRAWIWDEYAPKSASVLTDPAGSMVTRP